MDGLGIFKLFLTLCTVTFKIALKIEEGQTTQWPKEKGQTTIYKTLHIKLNIE
jgi:hypothetical protein